MLHRTFVLCGITSYLQVKLGHTYPIIDGPAGLWASMRYGRLRFGNGIGFGRPSNGDCGRTACSNGPGEQDIQTLYYAYPLFSSNESLVMCRFNSL